MRPLALPILLASLVLAANGCFERPEPDPTVRLPDGGAAAGGEPEAPVVGEPVPDAGTGQLPSGPRHEGYLRSEFYPRLVIEVDAVAGKLPSATAETKVVQTLTAILDKPEGVVIERDKTLEARGANYVWTFQELNELARSTFDRPVPAGTIKMHTLFVDGSYEQENVLGIAWASKYIVLFKDRLDAACNANLGGVSTSVCNEAVRGVWTHEVGHILGLVNNGLAMQTPHQDSEHGAHDSSTDCIMYWAYDTPSIIQRLSDDLLAGGAALSFDAQCLADIAAVRDR